MKQFRTGSITTLADADKAIRDMEIALQQVTEQVALLTDPAPGAGQIGIVVRLHDGTYQLWNLVAGAGATVTKNFGTKTITVTSP